MIVLTFFFLNHTFDGIVYRFFSDKAHWKVFNSINDWSRGFNTRLGAIKNSEKVGEMIKIIYHPYKTLGILYKNRINLIVFNGSPFNYNVGLFELIAVGRKVAAKSRY